MGGDGAARRPYHHAKHIRLGKPLSLHSGYRGVSGCAAAKLLGTKSISYSVRDHTQTRAGGDVKAGQNVFERLCSSCHRLSGIGNEVGPNLALAATRSPEELLTHILDPNRGVNPAYVQYNVETTDGEIYSGLIVADQPASVTLKGVNFEKTLPRTLIQKIGSAGQSLMPEGLEQGVSFQDMADLLGFLIDSHYDVGTSGHSDSHDVPVR